MEVPVEDWYVFKPEALRYLNLVATEIRIKASRDPLMGRVAERLAVHNVHHVGIARGRCPELNDRFEFHFEMDRGRQFKGHRYDVHYGADNLPELRRMGSDSRIPLGDFNLEDLEGQDLLDAIREIVVHDIMKV